VRYQITHHTVYTYSQPVHLQPHTLRLQPRTDGTQTLDKFRLSLEPAPENITQLVELDGNACHRVWFDTQAISQLTITTQAEVSTHRSNPFDYLADPWAVAVPIEYPQQLAQQLAPYRLLEGSASPAVIDLAQDLLHQVNENVGYFLTALTQAIYEHCQYVQRESGPPQLPGITWRRQAGTCRDFATLFMEACRVVGLAARFVSGYQEGDPDHPQNDLHAWAEVYIPGGGWRGFDPTHGLAVTDRHIALAAAAYPQAAAPVSGKIYGMDQVAQSTLKSQIELTSV
jgi:transglutaminase-like putative cysteine protease